MEHLKKNLFLSLEALELQNYLDFRGYFSLFFLPPQKGSLSTHHCENQKKKFQFALVWICKAHFAVRGAWHSSGPTRANVLGDSHPPLRAGLCWGWQLGREGASFLRALCCCQLFEKNNPPLLGM